METSPISADGEKTLPQKSKPTCGRLVEWTVERALALVSECRDWLNGQDNYFLQEFLIKKGHPYNCFNTLLRNFRRSKEAKPDLDFSEYEIAYKTLIKIQELKLVKSGLNGKHNPVVTNHILSVYHGFRKREEERALAGQINFNIMNVSIQNKSAAELARDYQSLIRGVSPGESPSIQGPREIRADIE